MKRNFLKSIIVSVFFVCALFVNAETKVACVGDSITWGGKKVKGKSFPTVLGKLLGSKWDVKNFGQSGSTLLRKSTKPYNTQAAKGFAPNIVIIKLGTNDTKSKNWKNKKDFVTDYLAMIKEFQNLKSKPTVWICRPVPANIPTKFGISGKIMKDEIIPLIDEVAKKANVPVIDLFTVLSGKNDLFPDTVHPNVEGHQLIAEAIHAALTGKK
jgi:acyl-CoA thioesterase I